MQKLHVELTDYALVIHDELGTEARRQVIKALDDEDAKKKAQKCLRGKEGCTLTQTRVVWELGQLNGNVSVG